MADDGQIERALDMAAALWRYWQMRGNLAEGRATLAELLARPAAAQPTTARARALSGLGGLAYWQSDMGAAEDAYVEGLALERSLDDPVGLIEALYNLGFVRGLASRHAEARALYEEAIQIADRIGNQMWILRLREALAFLMFHMGEYETALKLQTENQQAFRANGETFRAAIGTGFMTYLMSKNGQYAEARQMQREALATFRAADDRHWTARILVLAAASAIVAGDLTTAAELCGAYDVVREPLGDLATPVKTLNIPDPMVQAREGLGDAAFERAYAAGRALTLDEADALLAD